MGLIDFVQSAGRKIGLFGGRAAAEADAAKAAAALEAKGTNPAVAADIKAAILSYVPVANLAVTFDGTIAAVSGTATSQADREKAVLIAGNTEGVAKVDDRLQVEVPEPAATYHTVVKGDTLSEIAGKYYGVMRLYEVVFEANRPMLGHPDQIYPGQLLRIPPVRPPMHTVAKGETLGVIAKHWYGDPKKYTVLAEGNSIADPDKIEVGQKLTVPLIDPRVAPLPSV